MTKRIHIFASDWNTPGEVVTVEGGQIAWAGPIKGVIDHAGDFDAIFCHEDDEPRLRQLLSTARFEVRA